MCSREVVVSPRDWKASNDPANDRIPLDQGMSGEAQQPPRRAPSPQLSQIWTPAKQQYPTVDYSRYPSLGLGLITPPCYGYSPAFLASSVFGLKRLHSDGGGSGTITSTRELLACLAGCRSSSSSSSLSISGGLVGTHREGGAGALVDPVGVLCDEVVQQILGCLDQKSLGACLAVSQDWNKCARPNFLWDPICKQMWEGKMHVLPSAFDPAMSRLQAFETSLAEAQRVRIESLDLCRWVWEVHCKEEAGEYWRQLDPYYHGLPSMGRIFHEDGYITAEPMDRIWGGHECSWTLRKFKSRGGATLVQINHWPPLVVTRTSHWGWRMENAWTVYTSTDIPTVTNQSRQEQREPISDRVALVPDS